MGTAATTNHRSEPMECRLDFYQHGPGAMQAMAGLEQQIICSELEPQLIELVRLRTSQINGCGCCCTFCMCRQATAALQIRPIERRLTTLCVWRDTSSFTERERAALEWTEALTLVSSSQVPQAVWERVYPHFSPVELVDLTLAINTANAWNRFAIAFRRLPDDARYTG